MNLWAISVVGNKQKNFDKMGINLYQTIKEAESEDEARGMAYRLFYEQESAEDYTIVLIGVLRIMEE